MSFSPFPSVPPHVEHEPALPRPDAEVSASRLGMYSAMGASVGSLPVPWLPELLSHRVRGALVHDVATRHRVSLTRAARDVLAAPRRRTARAGVLGQVAWTVGGTLARRALARAAPVAFAWPLRAAVETFVLGHLFDRYLARIRKNAASCLDDVEARKVRQAIDGTLSSVWTQVGIPVIEPDGGLGDRGPATAFVDRWLGVTAGIPERLTRLLDDTFDMAMADDAR